MRTGIVVMGVSGCGKTTVAAALADRLGVPFLDADDLHPPGNVAKMRDGLPLDDEDRRPWLAAVADWLGDQAQAGHDGVVACSALRRAHRDVLRAAPGTQVRFVHLNGERDTIASRLTGRGGHFMPASLLDSQLDTLEPLEPDEDGVAVDLGGPPEEVTDRTLLALPLPE